ILTASYHMYQRFNDPLVNQHFRDEFSFEANIKEKAKSDHNTANTGNVVNIIPPQGYTVQGQNVERVKDAD
ncbi:MAG: hypothetical protein ACYC0F_20325, partial [Rhodanobacter sp.]